MVLISGIARRLLPASCRGTFGLWWLVLAIAAAGCGTGPGAGGGAPGGGRGGRGGPPGGGFAIPVEIATLELKPIERTGEFVGTVKSRRSTTIQPQVEGFVTRILVVSGARVERGAPLFEIDSTTQQAALAALQSQRAARDADATFARQQAERARLLFDAGAMSRQEWEQAATQQKMAEAQLRAFDEQIRQQQAELAYHRVSSPTAGVVGDVPVRVGDRVTRSTVLTTIDDNAGLEVYVNVPVQQAPGLRIGLPLRILDETGAVILTRGLSFVSASVEDATQTVLVKAPIEGQGGRFRSDQFVRTQLVWSTESRLVIPVTSVLRVSGQHFVFVAEPAEGGLVARQRQVTLGPVVGGDYLVVAGLAAGDRLVTGGIQKIGDGVPVQTGPPGGGPARGGDEGRGGGRGAGR